MSRGRYGNACIGTPGRHEGAVIVRESLDILAIGFNRHMGVIFAGRNSMQLDIELQYDFLFSIRRLSRDFEGRERERKIRLNRRLPNLIGRAKRCSAQV